MMDDPVVAMIYLVALSVVMTILLLEWTGCFSRVSVSSIGSLD